jgi:hypothetical protein
MSLAFAMLSAGMHPMRKYAMAHGRACTWLAIGGEALPAGRELGEAISAPAKLVAALMAPDASGIVPSQQVNAASHREF